MEHLREHLLREQLASQLFSNSGIHFIVMPDLREMNENVLADAVRESTEYFKSLLRIIYRCYDRFKQVVDPQWYYTRENFVAMGKTFEDAVVDLGLPPSWAAAAPDEDGGWRALRNQQPPCQINWLFAKYLGLWIAGPDD